MAQATKISTVDAYLWDEHGIRPGSLSAVDLEEVKLAVGKIAAIRTGHEHQTIEGRRKAFIIEVENWDDYRKEQ